MRYIFTSNRQRTVTKEELILRKEELSTKYNLSLEWNPDQYIYSMIQRGIIERTHSVADQFMQDLITKFKDTK